MSSVVAHRAVNETKAPASFQNVSKKDARHRGARLNEKGINMSLQVLADKMFFEYCEGYSVADIAKQHSYPERTIRNLCGKFDWAKRRKKMLLAIQAAQADQFVTDQGTRARYFYHRHGALLTAMAGAGENIIMKYAAELRAKGSEAEMSDKDRKALATLNSCLHFAEKIAAAAEKTFSPVQHGNIAFPVTGDREPPIETKNADGTSMVSWAATGHSLPKGKVQPHGGLVDKQQRTLDRLEGEAGLKVDEKVLPPSV